MTMPTAETAEEQAPSGENFAELLDEFVGDNKNFEGRLIKGTVLSIDNDAALIDVGLKVEGRVPLKEFSVPGQPIELKVGDKLDLKYRIFVHAGAGDRDRIDAEYDKFAKL